MKSPRQRSLRFEQLELFVERTKRPTWRNLPQAARERIVTLLARMLLDYQHLNDSRNERQEVVHER